MLLGLKNNGSEIIFRVLFRETLKHLHIVPMFGRPRQALKYAWDKDCS